MEELNTFIEDLAVSIRDGGLAVFCGAGISRNSGVPMVSEFLPEIFTALRFQLLDPATLSQQLPFEAIMEQIRWGGDITRLLDVFDGQFPNATHFFLG